MMDETYYKIRKTPRTGGDYPGRYNDGQLIPAFARLEDAKVVAHGLTGEWPNHEHWSIDKFTIWMCRGYSLISPVYTVEIK